MSADWVAVLESMYALDRQEDEWLRGLAGAALGCMDRGGGTMAWRYDVRDPDAPSFGPEAATGAAAAFLGVSDRVARERERGSGWTQSAYRRSRAVCTGREVQAMLPNREWDSFFPGDILTVRSSPTHPVGVLLGAVDAHPIRLSRVERGQLMRVAAHLGASFRLREGLRRQEAILRADGSTEHAEGEARDRSMRDALRDAARRMDRARSRLRKRDPWEAVSLWQALVSGRWSLVDRFDSDGRRYLVAIRNPMPRAELRALTAREAEVVTLAAQGMSSKLVGYHLGIGDSTASTLLARALRKLGVRRSDLPLLAKASLVDAGTRDAISSSGAKRRS